MAAPPRLTPPELRPPDCTQQIVGRAGEGKDPVHFAHAAMPHLAQHRQVADSDLLQLALRQLLDNACKYSPPGSAVKVRLELQNERAAVRVLNSGIPIRADERMRIFQRFYRGVEARRLAPGSGLGLYFAHKIVQALGWVPAVRSVSGIPCSPALRNILHVFTLLVSSRSRRSRALASLASQETLLPPKQIMYPGLDGFFTPALYCSPTKRAEDVRPRAERRLKQPSLVQVCKALCTLYECFMRFL